MLEENIIIRAYRINNGTVACGIVVYHLLSMERQPSTGNSKCLSSNSHMFHSFLLGGLFAIILIFLVWVGYGTVNKYFFALVSVCFLVIFFFSPQWGVCGIILITPFFLQFPALLWGKDISLGKVIFLIVLLASTLKIMLQPKRLFPQLAIDVPVMIFCSIPMMESLLKLLMRLLQGNSVISFSEINAFLQVTFTMGSETWLVWLLFIPMYFLFTTQLSCSGGIKKLFIMLILATTVISCFAILQYYHLIPYEHMQFLKYPLPWIDGRAAGTFWHYNHLATYLILVLPLIFSYALIHKSSLIKGAILVLFFHGVVAMILTFSRVGYLSFLVGTGVFFYLWNMGQSGIKKSIPWFIFPLSVIGVWLGIIIFKRGYDNIFTPEFMEHLLTLNYRIQIWQRCFLYMKGDFLLGIGRGVYNSIFHTHHAHSVPIHIFVETGFIGFISFCWLCLRVYKMITFTFSTNNMVHIGALSSLAAFTVNGLFEYQLYFYYMPILFVLFILLGRKDSISYFVQANQGDF